MMLLCMSLIKPETGSVQSIYCAGFVAYSVNGVRSPILNFDFFITGIDKCDWDYFKKVIVSI